MHGLAQCALDRLLAQMVAADHAAARIGRTARRRKHILPGPLTPRVGIFAIKRVRQIHLAATFRQVLLMQRAHAIEMAAQTPGHSARQHGDAILKSLALAHDDLAARKLNILHAQAQRFEQAQTTAIQQPAYQLMDTRRQPRQRTRHLVTRQHDRQAPASSPA